MDVNYAPEDYEESGETQLYIISIAHNKMSRK